MIASATPAPQADQKRYRVRKQRPRDDAPDNSAPGEICAGRAYTLREFSKRCGLGRWGIKSLRDAGLPVRHVARRTFVLGDDFIAFLRGQGDQPP